MEWVIIVLKMGNAKLKKKVWLGWLIMGWTEDGCCLSLGASGGISERAFGICLYLAQSNRHLLKLEETDPSLIKWDYFGYFVSKK